MFEKDFREVLYRGEDTSKVALFLKLPKNAALAEKKKELER